MSVTKDNSRTPDPSSFCPRDEQGNIPANTLAVLMARFDEVKNSGDMMPTATLALGTTDGRNLLTLLRVTAPPS